MIGPCRFILGFDGLSGKGSSSYTGTISTHSSVLCAAKQRPSCRFRRRQEFSWPSNSYVPARARPTESFARNSAAKSDTTRHALEQLSKHDREVLVLLYLEQLSVHEASEVLGISRRAMNMRHLRALRRLKPILTIG